MGNEKFDFEGKGPGLLEEIPEEELEVKLLELGDAILLDGQERVVHIAHYSYVSQFLMWLIPEEEEEVELT